MRLRRKPSKEQAARPRVQLWVKLRQASMSVASPLIPQHQTFADVDFEIAAFRSPMRARPICSSSNRGTQQAAWVAICELANALKEEGFAGPTLWKATLSATESWIELLI